MPKFIHADYKASVRNYNMKVLMETKKLIDPENYKIPIFTGNFKMEKKLNASGFYIRHLKAKFFAFFVNCLMSRIVHLQLALMTGNMD